MNSHPGQIKLRALLPASAPDSFTLYIMAADGGGRTSALPANVTLIIVQDTSQLPRFDESLYQFEVDENSPEGTAVNTVQATVGGE